MFGLRKYKRDNKGDKGLCSKLFKPKSTNESMETKINQSLGVCRFIYNFYLAHNKAVYEAEKRSVSGRYFPSG
jgi:putative transposase